MAAVVAHIQFAPRAHTPVAITGRRTCKLATSAPNRAPPASQAGAHTTRCARRTLSQDDPAPLPTCTHARPVRHRGRPQQSERRRVAAGPASAPRAQSWPIFATAHPPPPSAGAVPRGESPYRRNCPRTHRPIARDVLACRSSNPAPRLRPDCGGNSSGSFHPRTFATV
ncbi:uncharacterized protein SCHCODRAFT_02227655 [Schizophyllum commune H4-8]|uniref:uncharacterized protein n=1 Tax=Schizophyllum commune (strain H4-8 / FGSC 9210) TaxID=578458 RepID=UPI00215EB10F|nr:uncharacterized protein SCHCODRAFT_02227655 [Schizophyllum commune H4-8]KAI5895293.1 hypothetical protein SCHCODRAFT_02227655 [Schizophyllum commune H4-8]